MVTRTGSTSKDSMYLKRMKERIDGNSEHPRNNGIQMQAHHLISIEGMRQSGMAQKIRKFKYNINYLENLSFIPCTLQGACYLGVQPHRGNHGSFVDQDDYDDNIEEFSYHEMVANSVKGLKLPLSKECEGTKASKEEKVVGELDKLSKTILAMIQKAPRQAQLTSIAVHFGKGKKGCGGVDSVGDHAHSPDCPVGRNHLYNPKLPAGSQHRGQNKEKIKYVKPAGYKLKVGSDEKKLR